MPKLGMEPIRRAALIDAAIAEIGATGSLDVTVGDIARRAGVSSGLAHHYFGGKEDILLAAMRHVLRTYSNEVRLRLALARGHRARLEAIIRASFAPSNFQPHTVAAWVNFYVLSQSAPKAARLLKIYHGRLRSNLLFDLRPLLGSRAGPAAERLGAMIDGLYLRHSLGVEGAEGDSATDQALALLSVELGGPV